MIPNFIRRTNIHGICGNPKDDNVVRGIETRILKIAIRSKADHMYSLLLKCKGKESNCERLLPCQLWRRIVGESKSICDSIRSNTKVRLQQKFSGLVDKQRGNREVTRKNATFGSRPGAVVGTGEAHSPRVTLIGGVELSSDALCALDLGPSFAPSQYLSHSVARKIVGGLQSLHERLRGRAKIDTRGDGQGPAGRLAVPPPPFPATYARCQEPDISVDAKFRVLSTSLRSVLQRWVGRRPISNLTDSQKRGLNEVRRLTASGYLKVGVSDKGGEFVALPQDLDKAITGLHLQDRTTYDLSSQEEFTKQYRHLNRRWTDIAKSAGLPQSLVKRLKCELPSCPVLYVLLKTHKISNLEIATSTDPALFKVRPIVSNVGGPTDRISWFLNLILAQLFKFIPSHLPNTNAFLERLRNARELGEGMVLESFDVTSLYTNVSNRDAVQAVHEILIEQQGNINMYGLSIEHAIILLQECLNCNVFKWAGQYFKQIRGLAMGQRLAPALAVAFMSKIEAPVLLRYPSVYCRYIDDCFIACSTQSEVDTCFKVLNEQSQHIRLTREQPTEGWLAFLNVQVRLRQGSFETRWYRKPSSKNIVVHFLSAHPSSMKRAVINNMVRTAINVSSDNEHKAASREKAYNIAYANGYSIKCIPQYRRKRTSRVGSETDDTKIAFSIPFISDEFTRDIRKCVQQAGLHEDVRIVEVPPATLKKQLVRNRLYDRACMSGSCLVCENGNQGDCMTTGVVYLITCRICGDEYVGETGRPLCIRVKEHLDGIRKSSVATPLGEHRVRCHGGNHFDVEVSILAREPDIVARRTLEAFWIAARAPKINRKEERVAVTRELAPFADLCGFDLADRSH